MNGLPDPIAGKGYANILPALKVPEFGEIAQMQTANNQLALNAAKLAADQKAKADALAAAKAKADQKAAEDAKKAEAKQQADAWTLLKPEDSPLIGDAPKWAAEAYDKMVKEAQGLMAQGIDLNSFDPRAVAFRSGTLQNYHVNYKRHSEVAKALAEKQKQWSTKPDDYESYSLADELGSKYNVTGWDKDYYTPSLLPKVGVATPAEIAAYEKQMFGESASRVSQSKKPTGYNADGDAIYSETESYEARPFEAAAEDVNKNLRHSTDVNQKKLYNFYQNQAKAQGLVDENTGDILPQYFQKREEVTREKGGVKPVTVQIQKEKDGGGLNLNFNNNSGLLVGGTKNNPMIITYSGKNDTPFTKVYTSTVGEQTAKTTGDYVIRSVGELAQTGNFDPNSVPINQMKKVGKNGIEPVTKQEKLTSAENKILKYIPMDAQGNYIIDNKNPNKPINVDDPRIVKYRGVYTTPSEDRQSYIIIDGQAANPNDKDLRYEISREEGKATYLASKGQQVQQPQTPQNKTAPKGEKVFKDEEMP